MTRPSVALLLALSACGLAPSSATSGDASATDTSTTGSTSTTTATTTSPETGGQFVGATGSTGASSTGTESGEASIAFIVEPDDPSECDLFAQDCPPGQKCSFLMENLHRGYPLQRCVPVAPDPRLPDELCHFNLPGMGLDDCAVGSYCLPWPSDQAGASVCVALCAAETYACPDEDACIIMDFGLFWCESPCDPLLQDCTEGLACSLRQCQPVSPGYFDRPPGMPCEDGAQCVPKSTCVPAKYVPNCVEDYCCTEICDLQVPASCALPDQSCEPPPEDQWNWGIPEDEGLCILPP